MPNIKFNYLYRDAGNYKNYGSIVFTDPANIELPDMLKLIRSKLIDETWFYADEWNLPDLHFETWCNQADHTFHEFESIAYTAQAFDNGYFIENLISAG